MRKVSIIIPIIRPDSAERCIEAIIKNAGVPIGQYEIVQAIDIKEIGCPKMVRDLTEKTQHGLVMFLGDDTVPQKDFLKNALAAMETLPGGWGVVGLNTQDPRGANPVAHWLAHKKMLEFIEGGDFFSTDYAHCWCDNELRDIAEEQGRWAFAKDSRIEHRHPVNESAPQDEGYERAYTEKNITHDQKTYFIRKRNRMEKRFGRKLALAFPLTDIWTFSQFTFSILNVVMNHLVNLFRNDQSLHISVFMPHFPGQIDAIRNDLVLQALNDGCTHILMMDTDQIYSDIDMIEKLFAHKLPVVGAKVHRRYPPFDPILLRGDTNQLMPISDEEILNEYIVKVDATGCGCILYEMKVFDDIKHPWFELTTGEAGNPIGEDIGFCAKLKKQGFDIYVDCSIDIKHISLMAVDWGIHKLHKKLYEGVK